MDLKLFIALPVILIINLCHGNSVHFARKCLLGEYVKVKEERSKMCDKFIDELRNQFYSSMSSQFSQMDIADCVIDRLKKANADELMIKQMSCAISESISNKDRRETLRTLGTALEQSKEKAISFCGAIQYITDIFNSRFDKGVNRYKLGEETALQDYCVRRYLIDNNFININEYKVKTNPLRINVTSLDCDEINENIIEETELKLLEEYEEDFDRPSNIISQCLKTTIRSHNFFANCEKVTVLGEIGVPKEVKNKEKKIFISKMMNLRKNILLCRSQNSSESQQ